MYACMYVCVNTSIVVVSNQATAAQQKYIIKIQRCWYTQFLFEHTHTHTHSNESRRCCGRYCNRTTL